jgi:hypothetical protein
MNSPHHLRSSLCRMVAGLMLSAVPALGNAEPAWDAAAAAQYLETRLQWWRDWDRSGRDHGTKCVSCHTTLPYTLGMAALRSGAGLGSKAVPVAELAMLDDVVKRVYLWNEVEPFYPDQTRGIPKSSESRGVESVLNALILATRDAERGYLGADTRLAFGHMWNQQMKAGALAGGWAWLNFSLEPFESPTAPYWGATFAALAVARAPGYLEEAANADALAALRGFLRSGLSEAPSLHTRALLLWADSLLQGILDAAQRQQSIELLLAAQSSDGGWSLPALAPWQRVDGSALPQQSDGYATALLALALQEAGGPQAAAAVARARVWLGTYQDRSSGEVPALSINKERTPDAVAYWFMRDVATGLALLLMPAQNQFGQQDG